MENMKKEIRNRRILAIIAVFVLTCAYFVSGQLSFYKSNKNPDFLMVTNDAPLPIGYNDGDVADPENLYISMYVERISKDSVLTRMVVSYPKDNAIDKSQFSIQFDDLSIMTFKMVQLDRELNYAEYDVSRKAIPMLYNVEIKSFIFKSTSSNSTFVFPIKRYSEDFFVEFMRLCNK